MAKPKIVGYCAAGCEWEVPHKSDFDAYCKMASKFPEPTLNAAKQLDGAGYYYMRISTGNVYANYFVYWDGSSAMQLSLDIHTGTGEGNRLEVVEHILHINKSGKIVVEEVTRWDGGYNNSSPEFTAYTAKIVDTELPEQAEEVAF